MKSSDSDYTSAATEAWQRLLPDLDLSVLEVTMRIRRSAILVVESAESVTRQHGLMTYGDYEVLSTLRRSQTPLTPAALADRLMVTRPGITGRLERLESSNLITRHTNPSDARSLLVALTDTGLNTVDATFADIIDHQHQLLAELLPTDKEQLARHLGTLLLSMNDHPPTA